MQHGSMKIPNHC